MNVFRNLKKLLRPSRASNRVAKRRCVRLELESLDQRLLPSASMVVSQGLTTTNPLSAVTDVTGSATGFYLDPVYSHSVLYQLRDSVASVISSPLQTVSQFSAGLNANGFADVFADINGRIKRDNFDGQGWQGQERTIRAGFWGILGDNARRVHDARPGRADTTPR